MKDRRGALARASEIAGSVVAGVKRRQASRAPKVMLYDEDGDPRLLDPASDAAADLMATARKMVELVPPEEQAAEEPEEE